MSARLFATPAGVRLGRLEEIADGGARNYVVQVRDDRFHGFVVRHGDTICGYVDRCPHAGVPLARTLDDYLTPDGGFIACSWRGALFPSRMAAASLDHAWGRSSSAGQ